MISRYQKREENMVLAIDGPAGVGKSTVSRRIAEKTGMFYLNSGNFYRAVTLSALEKGVDPEDEKKIIETAEQSSFEIKNKRLHLDGRDVEDLLHSDAVDEWVAQHSAIVPVREIVNRNLRRIARNMDIVVEGRDITTVVFPDADVKIYLDASIETRSDRRFRQGVSGLSREEHLERIKMRDSIDKNKPVGSLTIHKDAFYLDTSDLTIDEVCEKVSQKIREANNYNTGSY